MPTVSTPRDMSCLSGDEAGEKEAVLTPFQGEDSLIGNSNKGWLDVTGRYCVAQRSPNEKVLKFDWPCTTLEFSVRHTDSVWVSFGFQVILQFAAVQILPLTSCLVVVVVVVVVVIVVTNSSYLA